MRRVLAPLAAACGAMLILAESPPASGLPCDPSAGVSLVSSTAWHSYENVPETDNPWFSRTTGDGQPWPRFALLPAVWYAYKLRCNDSTPGSAQYRASIEYSEFGSPDQVASVVFSCPSDGATLVGLTLDRDIGDWGRDLIGEASAVESQGTLDLESSANRNVKCTVTKPAADRMPPSPIPTTSPTVTDAMRMRPDAMRPPARSAT